MQFDQLDTNQDGMEAHHFASDTDRAEVSGSVRPDDRGSAQRNIGVISKWSDADTALEWNDTPFGLVASVPPSARDPLPTSAPAPVEAQNEAAGGSGGSTSSFGELRHSPPRSEPSSAPAKGEHFHPNPQQNHAQ